MEFPGLGLQGWILAGGGVSSEQTNPILVLLPELQALLAIRGVREDAPLPGSFGAGVLHVGSFPVAGGDRSSKQR